MRKRHNIRREEIARAALQLLAEEGPRHLTARNLGERVGMDGSSLFRHFENKAGILHAALDQFEAALSETIPDDTSPSWEGLKIFFVGRLTLVQARPEIIRLAFNQHLLEVSGENDHTDRVRAVVQRSVKFVRACLEHARAEGIISIAAPVEAQVWVVVGILRGAALGPAPQTKPEEAWEWLASTLQK